MTGVKSLLSCDVDEKYEDLKYAFMYLSIRIDGIRKAWPTRTRNETSQKRAWPIEVCDPEINCAWPEGSIPNTMSNWRSAPRRGMRKN